MSSGNARPAALQVSAERSHLCMKKTPERASAIPCYPSSWNLRPQEKVEALPDYLKIVDFLNIWDLDTKSEI